MTLTTKRTQYQSVALHFGLKYLNANEGKPKDKGRPLFLKETITFIVFIALFFLISLLCPLITYNTVNIKMAFRLDNQSNNEMFP